MTIITVSAPEKRLGVAQRRLLAKTLTDAVLEPEESATTAPPEGAAAESTTLPVTVPPLATELGDRVRL